MILGGRILGWIARIVLGAAIVLATLYVGDFVVFSVRGKPLDQVMVTRYMAAPMKNNKTACYFESSGPEPCARALFPQAGHAACWNLKRHPLVADQPD